MSNKIDDILQKFSNTISLGIMGNVPGAEGTPIYTNPEQVKDALYALIRDEVITTEHNVECHKRYNSQDICDCGLDSQLMRLANLFGKSTSSKDGEGE